MKWQDYQVTFEGLSYPKKVRAVSRRDAMWRAGAGAISAEPTSRAIQVFACSHCPAEAGHQCEPDCPSHEYRKDPPTYD